MDNEGNIGFRDDDGKLRPLDDPSGEMEEAKNQFVYLLDYTVRAKDDGLQPNTARMRQELITRLIGIANQAGLQGMFIVSIDHLPQLDPHVLSAVVHTGKISNKKLKAIRRNAEHQHRELGARVGQNMAGPDNGEVDDTKSNAAEEGGGEG